jgi:Ankyrin repeat
VKSKTRKGMSALHFAAAGGELGLQTCWLKLTQRTQRAITTCRRAEARASATAGHKELVQLLVQKKANVTAQNRAGKTAAELAKDDATKQLLLQVGGTQSISYDKSGTCDVQAETEDTLLRRQRSSRRRRQQIHRLLRRMQLQQRCQQHQIFQQKEGAALDGSRWRLVPMQQRTRLTVQQVLPQRQMGGASGNTHGRQGRTRQKRQ